MRRFFLDKNNIKNEKIVIIDGDEFFHMNKVLRVKAGEEVIVCVGDGYDYFCHVVDSSKDFAQAEIVEKVVSNKDAKIDLTVFQAMPKGDKLELIEQKLAELGVKELIPFESEFCNAKCSNLNYERLNKISVCASKQCGRSKNLIIGEAVMFDSMINLLGGYDLVLFAYENENKISLKDVLTEHHNAKNIALIVGSEGGFSEKESTALAKQAKVVSVGTRILRCETAAIAISSAIMYELGEWEI